MMLLIAALAAATASPPSVQPNRQARASVRIMRAEPLAFQQIERTRPEWLRTTMIRTRDGRTEQVRLVEFQ